MIILEGSFLSGTPLHNSKATYHSLTASAFDSSSLDSNGIKVDRERLQVSLWTEGQQL